MEPGSCSSSKTDSCKRRRILLPALSTYFKWPSPSETPTPLLFGDSSRRAILAFPWWGLSLQIRSLDSDFNHANPRVYCIESPAFRKRFAVAERKLLDHVLGYIKA